MVVPLMRAGKLIAWRIVEGFLIVPGVFATIDLALQDYDFTWLEEVNVFGKLIMSVASIVYGLIVLTHKVKMDSIKRDREREVVRKMRIENNIEECKLNNEL